MEITFTKEELTKYAQDLDDWYNQRSIYVLTEGFGQISPMTGKIDRPIELFHKLAKVFQEDHPKPDWRNLL